MRKAQIPVAVIARQLSSTPGQVAKGFVAQRSDYQQQLSELRKQWKEEFELKEKAKLEQQAAEKQRIVLERAIRLREDRKLSQERQEMARKRRALAALKYREKLARTHLVHDEQAALQKTRDQLALQAVANEAEHWITLDNVDTKITEALFEAPGRSTGLSYEFSEYMQYQTFVPTIHRMLTDPLYSRHTSAAEMTQQKQQQKESDRHVLRRIMVEEFLNESIGSAEERSQFRQLVKDFSKNANQLNMFRDIDIVLESEYEGDKVLKELEIEPEELEELEVAEVEPVEGALRAGAVEVIDKELDVEDAAVEKKEKRKK